MAIYCAAAERGVLIRTEKKRKESSRVGLPTYQLGGHIMLQMYCTVELSDGVIMAFLNCCQNCFMMQISNCLEHII